MDSGDDVLGWDMAHVPYRLVVDSVYDGVHVVDQDRKIRYWNPAAEELTGFSRSEVVGSSCADNLLCHVDDHGTQLCTDGCPLAETLADGRRRDVQAFLHHRDGHRVPVHIRAAPVTDADGHVVAAVEVFSDATPTRQLHAHVQELSDMAFMDALTQQPNRRCAQAQLGSSLAELARYGWSFGLMFVDIDSFKQFNDAHTNSPCPPPAPAIADPRLPLIAAPLSAASPAIASGLPV